MRATTSTAPSAAATFALPDWLSGKKTRSDKADRTHKVNRNDLAFILRNVATLVENGVSLPKALAAVSQEKSLRRHAPMLDAIRRKVENGETFSGALADFPETFDELTVNQIRVGEKSGTLSETLTQITTQREKMNALRSLIIKKLAYPILLMVMGSGVVTFMLVFVVPVFEETYADAKIPLPLVTQFMIAVGRFASTYYWMFGLGGALAILIVRHLRRKPHIAREMDRKLLHLPLLGNWFRDLAVLQLMEVLGNLMESGFRIAEALGVAANSVGNRAVREGVQDLQAAVQRGERFSRELERHGDLFPPVVSQLVIVGEQTGKLTKATRYIREHLHREIERRTTVMVGTIEPVLTILLAAAIGVILLAIYLPMFDMIGAIAS